MKGQVEDSPAVEEMWDESPSPFAKLERQWDAIYLAEFPEVTAAPRWGTPSWTTELNHVNDEEDSDEVVEARLALPTSASSGVSAELEGSAELSPLPAPRAPGSGRAAPRTAPTSPAAPPPG
ncbi:hypothetical protein Emag_006153 [Eimeria magna]